MQCGKTFTPPLASPEQCSNTEPADDFSGKNFFGYETLLSTPFLCCQSGVKRKWHRFRGRKDPDLVSCAEYILLKQVQCFLVNYVYFDPSQPLHFGAVHQIISGVLAVLENRVVEACSQRHHLTQKLGKFLRYLPFSCFQVLLWLK